MPTNLVRDRCFLPALVSLVLFGVGAAQAQVLVPNLVYTSIVPCRVFDTRSSTAGKLLTNTSRTFNIVGGNVTSTTFTGQGGTNGGCSIPGFGTHLFIGGSIPLVQAVAINFAVLGPASAGVLTAWPTDHSQPGTSEINFSTLTLANHMLIPVRQDVQGGDITLVASANTDVLGDVVGYFSSNSATSSLDADNMFLGPHAGNPASSTGGANTAIGAAALDSLSSGDYNVALGQASLSGLTSGSGNIALGDSAALSYTGSETSNIVIGNSGVAGESNVIRIGASSGGYTQSKAFVAGISGSTSSSGIAVYVNTSGQLGTTTSSLRFKEDVQAMGDASQDLMRLRPVTFHYQPQYDDGSRLLQYGLIAEDVAKVYPGLVQYDKDGKPLAVRYQFVDAMLLNEVQQQRRTLDLYQGQLGEQKAALGGQQARVQELEQQVKALVARLELER
ncbi:MAG TPA: tail fiber domain-containing protein [Thermoanaerobaculia bacterium]|nr:tail fiber domain-containing protein [Thermoanaerobaculia bacterium]